MTEERTCYTCKDFRLCFLRRRVDEALIGAGILNIDSNDAPKNYVDIFDTLAKMCLAYIFKKKT